jgi:hypothetical protein
MLSQVVEGEVAQMVVQEEMLSWTIELRLGAWGIVTILSRDKGLAKGEASIPMLRDRAVLRHGSETYMASLYFNGTHTYRWGSSQRSRSARLQSKNFWKEDLTDTASNNGNLPEHTSERIISQLYTHASGILLWSFLEPETSCLSLGLRHPHSLVLMEGCYDIGRLSCASPFLLCCCLVDFATTF